MRKLVYASIFVLFTLFSYTVAHAQSSVYLPLSFGENGVLTSVGDAPSDGTIPPETGKFAPDYTSLSLDINPLVAKEVTAINFVNNPPNATTTITNVITLPDYDMGDLVGTNNTGRAYLYDHNTKTKNESCVVMKAYRENGENFLTIALLACYPTLDRDGDLWAQLYQAYVMFNQVCELYAK